MGLLDADGIYTFQSDDVRNYPAGDYIFEFIATTGTNNDMTATKTFTLTLINPCPDSIISEDPAA